jgi:uncharacterized protein (DUF362 family)/Pyruvate/2-oxoacid:ferredoxin oxidoreductase delta subunit
MSDTVALAACKSYEQTTVDEAVKRAFDLLGGLSRAIKPGMRVVIKPNLLRKTKPEACVVTHPSVICAVARQVAAIGAFPVIGDSPGGPFTEFFLKSIYRESGMEQASKDSGAELNFDTSAGEARIPDGVGVKSMQICNFILKADAVINVAKLKTHGLTTYTGAVKNLFGAVPGTTKLDCHFVAPELERFSDILVDVCETVKPVLSLIDAVMGMEGEGPGSGTPRFVGCLVASTSPHAADMAGIALMNRPPMSVCTLKRANERGLVAEELAKIDCVGDRIEDFIVTDYDVPAARLKRLKPRRVPDLIMKRVERLLKPKPVFLRVACIGCAECFRSCPPKAIEMKDNFPVVNLDKCIRCFCCQEMCPAHAVKIKRSRALELLK